MEIFMDQSLEDQIASHLSRQIAEEMDARILREMDIEVMAQICPEDLPRVAVDPNDYGSEKARKLLASANLENYKAFGAPFEPTSPEKKT